jgi:hypothetical protein
MTEEWQRVPSQSASRIYARFNSLHFKGQNGRVSIVGARARIKVLSTRSWDSFFCMASQLLEHPVIVRLWNVCIPNFPATGSHHLPRQDALRRWHNRSRIPQLSSAWIRTWHRGPICFGFDGRWVPVTDDSGYLPIPIRLDDGWRVRATHTHRAGWRMGDRWHIRPRIGPLCCKELFIVRGKARAKENTDRWVSV